MMYGRQKLVLISQCMNRQHFSGFYSQKRFYSQPFKFLLNVGKATPDQLINYLKTMVSSNCTDPILLSAASQQFYLTVDEYYPPQILEALSLFGSLHYTDAYVVGGAVGRIDDLVLVQSGKRVMDLLSVFKANNISHSEVIQPTLSLAYSQLPVLSREIAPILSCLNELYVYDPKLADLLLFRASIQQDYLKSNTYRILDAYTRGYSRLGLSENENKQLQVDIPLPSHLLQMLDKALSGPQTALTDIIRIIASFTRIGDLDNAVKAKETAMSFIAANPLSSADAVHAANQLAKSGLVDGHLMSACVTAVVGADTTAEKKILVLTALSQVAPHFESLEKLWTDESLPKALPLLPLSFSISVCRTAAVQTVTASKSSIQKGANTALTNEALKLCISFWRLLSLNEKRTLVNSVSLLPVTSIFDGHSDLLAEYNNFVALHDLSRIEVDGEDDSIGLRTRLPATLPKAVQVGNAFSENTVVSVAGNSFFKKKDGSEEAFIYVGPNDVLVGELERFGEQRTVMGEKLVVAEVVKKLGKVKDIGFAFSF